jgi:hypothetical protein
MVVLRNKTFIYLYSTIRIHDTGADPGGGGGGGGTPGALPPKIGKNKIFWRKIVIFHTKYPKICRTSLRSAQFF